MSFKTDRNVQLAPPGAGLPFLELILSRIVFHLGFRRISRTAANRRFDREAGRILELVGNFPPTLAQEQVLITRITGIEDSSRNWSLWMAVEHLNIVNPSISSIIQQLALEKPFGREISTAHVKPPVVDTPAVLDNFRHTTNSYLQSVGKISKLNSKQKHAHPWFGPLNAHGWHCLAAFHQSIHRRQIETIIRQLETR